MRVPFVDLKAQYHSIKREIDAEILETLGNPTFALDKKVETFEKAFAQFCDAKHAVGVNSGTAALHVALLEQGLDEARTDETGAAGDQCLHSVFWKERV